MFHLVPLACARRKVAHGDLQTDLVGQPLQLQLPQFESIPVAAPTIGRDEQSVGRRIKMSSLMPPPSSYRRHGKSGRVVIGSHVHETRVLPKIVDAVGIGSRHRRVREVVALNMVLRR